MIIINGTHLHCFISVYYIILLNRLCQASRQIFCFAFDSWRPDRVSMTMTMHWSWLLHTQLASLKELQILVKHNYYIKIIIESTGVISKSFFCGGGGGGQKSLYYWNTHSKNTRVSVTRKRVHWGQTPFRVHDDPEISQLDTECDPEIGQSDPIICPVCRKLTNFRVIFDPEWSLAPMDLFRVTQLTRVFLECIHS